MNELESRFQYVRPSADGIVLIEEARAIIRDAVTRLQRCLPPCRETALVWTKLEEASMWANKAIAFAHPHVEPEPLP